MDATSLLDVLRARVPAARAELVPTADYTTFTIAAPSNVDVLRTLRDDPALGFTCLAELTAVDYLPREPRFEVVYHLLRVAAPVARLRIKAPVPGDPASLPTVTSVFPDADWLEREVWDLFGIGFEGHPDLRRLLLMDDWDGHPLRKDYPVQVKVPYRSTDAVQLTEEEFVANIERQRVALEKRSR
jgi:NADH-quinone oxidoreductase subunit C